MTRAATRSLLRTSLLVGVLAAPPPGALVESPNPSEVRDRFVPRGWRVEEDVQGDLNGDGVADHVLMLLETKKAGSARQEQSRMLLVLAGRSDGALEQIGVNRSLLLCAQCLGALGGKPRLSIRRRVLVVEQERGSRETASGVWRFRFEAKRGRMRLIGLDVRKTDRVTGTATRESTNHLTGQRITESLQYDERQQKDVTVSSTTTSIATTAPIFLEDVDATSLD